MLTRVAHVGIQVPDLQRSVDHAVQVLGLREVERLGGASYLTCNERHHELVLIQGEAVACDHLAFEVYEARELEALRTQLADASIATIADGSREPGVADAVRFAGPGGFVFEVLYGMDRGQPRHYASSGARPRKFEHITIKSSVKDEMEVFLRDVLGLRVSDRAGDAITWLRAGVEHHGVSVIGADVDQLQHYAWQIDGWDAIRRTGDHLMAHGRQFLWGPGHHGIGDNYFCYFLDEDGVIVEYSADILRIEDEAGYEPRTWPDEPLSVNRWGNPPPPQEFVDGGVPNAPVREGAAR
jgi:catechol 2,3-dioxygenase-like lactoylglutathione lyase family enzyme